VSRNFDNQGYLLCETERLGVVFALVPEAMFEGDSGLAEMLTYLVPLVTGSVAVVSTTFLLLLTLFQPSTGGGSGKRTGMLL